MKTSVEISMYPLNEDYEKPILDFIERLNNYKGLLVETNGMSTQVFGDYDIVMDTLKHEIKTTFVDEGKVVFAMKVLNGHAKLD